MRTLSLLTLLALPAFTQDAYFPLTPCRALDTRESNPHTLLKALDTRSIKLVGTCEIPVNATSVAVNVTVIPTSKQLGFLTVWPTSATRPLVSLLNSLDGSIRNNGAIVSLSKSGELSLYTTDDTHVIIDVSGYFAPVPVASTPTASDRIQLGPGVCSLRTRERTGFVLAFFKCSPEVIR